MLLLKNLRIFFNFFCYISITACLRLALWPFPKNKRYVWLNIHTHRLMKRLVTILGVKTKLTGNVAALNKQGQLFIARHIGYLDGLILGSLVKAAFVSKNDVRRWPVFGQVVSLGQTIFINRQNKMALAKSVGTITSCLENNVNVVIFPEGTSTDGTNILPFQTAFFAAPLQARAKIVPVSIEYKTLDGASLFNSDTVCWYG